jgi:hypothetical protein
VSYDGLFFILVCTNLWVLFIFSWHRLWANHGLRLLHSMGYLLLAFSNLYGVTYTFPFRVLML